ncbi:hypothetical protein QP027_03925 [Corynebacterium breve]|uniref:Secreted protein n=1 Tax=Corynebacterium breve TaxID=3049799 RepID=A0ABY8VHK5_9CORY|nr:hypothetical protein [Corynebacterium breve]WIM68552.1 hypothetical protein QP027_03925 [Corynebacterium breve]
MRFPSAARKLCTATLATVVTVATFTSTANAQPVLSVPGFDLKALTSSYLDELGRPNDHTVSSVNDFADQPYVPNDVANALRTAVAFFSGAGGELGGPPLPDDAPAFTQFYWPTVSSNCMGSGLHSTASVIAVPGPASSPAPAPSEGQATFVFTALGTPPAAEQQDGMKAYWLNTSTLATGVTPLDNNGINPAGPTTLSGVASTGSGTVIAVVSGTAHTQENSCSFAPTAAMFNVR